MCDNLSLAQVSYSEGDAPAAAPRADAPQAVDTGAGEQGTGGSATAEEILSEAMAQAERDSH